MEMARPNAESQQVTFYRSDKGSYSRSDPGGLPYDWGEAPLTPPSKSEVVVDCVVEYVPRASMADITSVGEFNMSRAEILVFADGYAEIKDIRATHVKLGGSDFKIASSSPSISLFDVDFYQLAVEAIDEKV